MRFSTLGIPTHLKRSPLTECIHVHTVLVGSISGQYSRDTLRILAVKIWKKLINGETLEPKIINIIWQPIFSVSELPRWSGINHFRKIINVHFSDASKFEDILKVSIVLIASGIKIYYILNHLIDRALCLTFNAHRNQEPSWISSFTTAPNLPDNWYIFCNGGAYWKDYFRWARRSQDFWTKDDCIFNLLPSSLSAINDMLIRNMYKLLQKLLTRTGIFQKTICFHTFSMTSWIKEWLETTIRSQMNKCMARLRTPTTFAPILKMWPHK